MPLKLTAGAKRQFTQGKKVFENLVRTGGRLGVDLLSEGEVRLDVMERLSMSSWFGRLEHVGTERLSVEEMNEVSAAGWAGDSATPRAG